MPHEIDDQELRRVLETLSLPVQNVADLDAQMSDRVIFWKMAKDVAQAYLDLRERVEKRADDVVMLRKELLDETPVWDRFDKALDRVLDVFPSDPIHSLPAPTNEEG